MSRSPRIGPLFLTAAFLAIAASTFLLLRRSSTPGQEPELAQPDRRILRLLRELRPAPPLERAPGPPVGTPELPDASAGKDELWRYGERYLGWEALVDVDLDQYSSAELRAWLVEDRNLYAHADRVGYDE